MRNEQVNSDSGHPLPAIVVNGAGGRMGARLLALAGDAGVRVIAAWVSPQSRSLGTAVAGHNLEHAVIGQTAVGLPSGVIDFSGAEGFDGVLAWCRRAGVALVSGTTGLSDQQRAAMSEAAGGIPVLWSANFSPGVAVLKRIAAQAARALPDWHLEIVEAHHAGKRDAPSGTALALGEAVADARGQTLDSAAVTGRKGLTEARVPGEIGFASIRAGDIVGEHTVFVAGPGERLELSHRAMDRDIFARGALLAARWLAGKPPGLYHFEDVFEPAAD